MAGGKKNKKCWKVVFLIFCRSSTTANTPSYRLQNNQHVDCGPLNKRRRKRKVFVLVWGSVSFSTCALCSLGWKSSQQSHWWFCTSAWPWLLIFSLKFFWFSSSSLFHMWPHFHTITVFTKSKIMITWHCRQFRFDMFSDDQRVLWI